MKYHHDNGLTVVELLVTVAIILLLSTSATLGLTSLVNSLKDHRALALVVGTIREAQVRAVQESRPYGVQFAPLALIQGTVTVDPGDCTNSASWSAGPTVDLPSGVSIAAASMDGCVSFAASGRPAWEATLNTDETTQPFRGDLLQLLDGVEMAKPPSGTNILSNAAGVTFKKTALTPKATVQVNLGDLRYVDAIGIGLISCRKSTACITDVTYPSEIRVRASTKENPNPGVAADWTFSHTNTGLTPASTDWERTALSVPVGGDYRTVEIAMTLSTLYTVVDEVNAGELHVVLNGRTGDWKVSVAQVTGRVQVEKVK